MSALLAAAITLSLVALALISQLEDEIAIRGLLLSSHAQLSENCSPCHEASPDAVQGVLPV